MDREPEMQFRPAGPDDMDEVGRLLGSGHRAYFEARLHAQDQHQGLILAAVVDGAIAGAVWMSWSPADEPEIRQRLEGVPLLYHFEVRKELRGQRIGTRLLRAAEEYLRDAGFDRVALGVDLDNMDARRLYERLGYIADKELSGLQPQRDDDPEAFGDPFDVLVHDLVSKRTDQQPLPAPFRNFSERLKSARPRTIFSAALRG